VTGSIGISHKFYTKSLTITESGDTLAADVSKQMESYKQLEIQDHRISEAGWTGRKKDFYNFLKKIAEARGFEFKKKKWRKTFGEALEFCFSVDSGMQRTWTFQLPLIFEIIHKAAPDLVMLTWNADDLMPSFHYYRIYRSPERAILGLQAHVDLLDAIGKLIVNRPKPA
jgi:hypothetical protein